MQLLTPLSLLLAGLAIPIILLYMLKLRRKQVQVSSTFLWEQLLREQQANAPWQKLKRNTYLNISVGLTSSKILLRDIQKNTTEPFGLPKELYEQKLASSPNLNFSLIRHEKRFISGSFPETQSLPRLPFAYT